MLFVGLPTLPNLHENKYICSWPRMDVYRKRNPFVKCYSKPFSLTQAQCQMQKTTLQDELREIYFLCDRKEKERKA